ncbi:M12 family metallo-peptidase [Streptomyces sp. NBC_00237]|uniref:InlB B-repeat-containing protein n=1 Tax=Streptomyces sp. NBC_00237 TaxID=2975687 RepID=UPI002252030A|nr:M12 family metallo-peptidase [Streptomyces sp. NBC_00237]MCX5205573.1 M12 family metallo-peptidase [Streptomyces sp. NBC_00237]
MKCSKKWIGGVALGAMALGSAGFSAPPAPARPAASVFAGPGAVLSSVPADQPEKETDGGGTEAVRQRNAMINPQALAALCAGPSEREYSFPLFDDVTVEVVEHSRSVVGDIVILSADVVGAAGQHVVATAQNACDGNLGNEQVTAQFMLGGDSYAIESNGPGRVSITQVTPLGDEDESVSMSMPPAPDTQAPQPRTAPVAPDKACQQGSNTTLIDLVVGYTPKALAEAGSVTQIRSDITRAVALANDGLADSKVNARLRLVNIPSVSSVPAVRDGVTQDLIKALATPRDGLLDEMMTYRDQYGADLVSVVAGGRAAGGLGYSPKAPSQKTANYGFNVVAHAALKNFSLGHEIGHNLGAAHDRTTQPNQPPPYGANGYFPSDGDFATMMAYESGCRKSTKGRCGRINQFSNPDLSYRGQPLGVPLGRPDEADAARIFNTTSKAIATYRSTKSSDTLCAVNTSVSPARTGTVTPSETGPYPKNSTMRFTAKPASGYVFSHWTLNGRTYGNAANSINIAVPSDQRLVANFRTGSTPKPSVSTSATRGGTVRKAPAKRGAPATDTLLYDAVPARGWSFSGWTLNGSFAGDDDTIELSPDDENLQLRAEFERNKYDLDIQVEGGSGKVVQADTGPYAEGDTVTVTATPDRGYKFTGWLLDGDTYGGDVDGTRGETAVSFQDNTDHTLTARFAPLN